MHHISVDDLRRLKLGQLSEKQKARMLTELEGFGLTEAYISSLEEEDLEAIAELSETTSDRAIATAGTITPGINWVGIGVLLVGVLVVMVLILDGVTPDSVRQEKEEEAAKEQLEEPDSPLDKVMNIGKSKNPVEERDEPMVDENTDSDPVMHTDDNPSSNDTPEPEDKPLQLPPDTSTSGTGNGNPIPDPVKDDDPVVGYNTPVKNYVSVKSAKVIMEQAVNKNKKYTPADVPQYPGGRAALEKYVRDRVGKIAHDNNNFGHRSVMVEFEVSSKGQVENVSLMTGLSRRLDDETVKIIENMPNWRTKGKKVRMKYQMSVKYW